MTNPDNPFTPNNPFTTAPAPDPFAGHPTISTVQLARAIQLAQSSFDQHESRIAAAHRVLSDVGASSDWVVILIAVLNDSPKLAEAWAERRLDEAFTRMQVKIEEVVEGRWVEVPYDPNLDWPIVDPDPHPDDGLCLACGQDCGGRCDYLYESEREDDE